ncbi:MAG: ferritin-like domain-containing protein [Ktedonobacteraceae bacterium]|nr:ferritin-like domain-containing protein [Ktedonobacteraceae bacterium]
MKSTLRRSTHSASRRSMMKGTVVGVTSLAAAGGVVGAGVFLAQRQQEGSAQAAASVPNAQAIQNILNIAATAETLAVVFYTEVLEHEYDLDLRPGTRLNIHAALIEEQLHLQFLNKHGARALTQKFSFPHGRRTFEDLGLFLKTQQQLESAFVAAYLAAVKEFAQAGRPDLAQIAGQIGAIEAEHRVIGRVIGAQFPANNEAFAPLLLNAVAEAPAFLKGAGYLNPVYGNAFSFRPASTRWNAITGLTPGQIMVPTTPMPTVVPSSTPALPPTPTRVPGAPPVKF